MTSVTLKELTDGDIKFFLENVSLYTWRQFKKPQINRESLWIREIDAFCKTCERQRPFQDLRSSGSNVDRPTPELQTGTSTLCFSCVSCMKSHQIYLVEHVLDDEFIRMQKFGELPRTKLPHHQGLQKFLKDDLDNYEKAVACLHDEYGVAAFAYFRRVVENNINRLLNLIREDVQSSGAGEKRLKAISDLRNDTRMSNKIKVANLALPDYLKPDGLNPLKRLYEVLSEGVHNLPDDECLRKAKTISDCLMFLVSELSSRQENRSRFKSAINQL